LDQNLLGAFFIYHLWLAVDEDGEALDPSEGMKETIMDVGSSGREREVEPVAARMRPQL
jgi:hypothetical protein